MPESSVRAVSLRIARVPMARAFGHAARRRTASESVLLGLRDEAGEHGWGEAAPRGYVTGERPAGVLRVLGGLRLERLRLPEEPLGAVRAVERFCRELREEHPEAPSALAAVETALLDLLARRAGLRLTALLARALGVPEPAPAPFPVALVIDSTRRPRKLLAAMPEPARSGLEIVKLKVGPDPRECLERLAEAAGLLGPGTAIALDANGSWRPEAMLPLAGRLRELGAAWVEEPFRPRRWREVARLAAEGLPVMLDESFRDEADLDRAAQAGASSVNLRVSKCGGPLRTARLHRLARERGLEAQLGVQVGEIGPLWAAGRALAPLLPGLLAIEAGRQDEWFPEPLTRPAFRVDRLRSRAEPLPGPGHGVVPSAALSAALAAAE